jgi:imidazole glycerol phosphate synthase glutamine amidotransferase subunit
VTARITVLDFGLGNLRSVGKALERAGAEVAVAPDVDAAADALVVPGQGHFGSCITNLGARLDDVKKWIADGRPYLGICLGLQVLFDGSEESSESGAGVFGGDVIRLGGDVKVPHIGWNEITPRAGTRLFDGIDAGERFYFVHSYAPVPFDPRVCAATTEYGIEFCSAAEHENVFATQFHPEKSGDAGARVLRNFVDLL